MFWFIILLLIVGGCFYLYHRMVVIEEEIRAGQAIVKKPTSKSFQDTQSDDEAEEIVSPPVVTTEVENMAPKVEPVANDSLSLEDEIFNAVKNLPGLKQTELYDSFADINKKKLQQLLKEMNDEGKIKREKKGSSYLLFPA
jgi:hypothetical protein